MGTILDLPTDPKTQKGRKWERGRNWDTGYYRQTTEPARNENNLQTRTPVILPFNSFDIRPERVEETGVKTAFPSSQTTTPRTAQTTPRSPQPTATANTSNKTLPSDLSRLEVETTKLNSNASSVLDETGSQLPRHSYIKRYRNEEEKLMDMLQERERTLRTAIRHGQQLRAKCNRYKEELENFKTIFNTQMTDSQWKRKYMEVDKKYRDAREQLEVMTARNKNGRDFMGQQRETIDILNNELQREKFDKRSMMSNSLSSIHSNSVIKDKKGKVAITQLMIDNQHLEERVNDLTIRNKRGREYLARLEAENREHGAMIVKLKTQLQREQADKEDLIGKWSSHAGSVVSDAGQDLSHGERPINAELYATVQKVKKHFTDEEPEPYSPDTKSTGFELDDGPIHRSEDPNRMGGAYEVIDFSVGMAKAAKDNVSEEEVIIEAIIEPESDESDNDEREDEHGTKDRSAPDERDGGPNSDGKVYQTKLNGDTITRF